MNERMVQSALLGSGQDTSSLELEHSLSSLKNPCLGWKDQEKGEFVNWECF